MTTATEEVRRVDGPAGRSYVTPDGVFPSVTTILGATADRTGLEAWAEAVGRESAETTKTARGWMGSNLHENIEAYLRGSKPPSPDVMFYRMREKVLDRIEHVIAVERAVWHPEVGYAGSVDAVGVWRSLALPSSAAMITVLDWKNSRKPKKEEHVRDYFLQVTAYASALRRVGVPVERLCVAIAMEREDPQVFEFGPAEAAVFWDEFKVRVHRFRALAVERAV